MRHSDELHESSNVPYFVQCLLEGRDNSYEPIQYGELLGNKYSLVLVRPWVGVRVCHLLLLLFYSLDYRQLRHKAHTRTVFNSDCKNSEHSFNQEPIHYYYHYYHHHRHHRHHHYHHR